MNDSIQTLVRAILKIGGGALVARGFDVPDGTIDVATGAIVALIGVVWGLKHRSTKPDNSDPRIQRLLFGALLVPTLFLFGCASNPPVQPVYAPGTTNVIAYAPSPNWSNAIVTGRDIAPALPSPANIIFDGVMAAAMLGLGAYAKFKTNALQAKHDALAETINKQSQSPKT